MSGGPSGSGATAGTSKPTSDALPSGAPAPTGSSESGGDAAPDTITATKGQYFCEFAAQKGFRNCEKWRAVNPDLADRPNLEEGDEVIVPEKEEGATADKDKAEVESLRVDFPPASVRFVGQTSSLGDRTKAGLTRVGISNYQTDKAGLNDNGHTHDFFEGEGAEDEEGRNADEDEVTTWNDPDHFRIEVHDVTAGKQDADEVTVELQVLQPLYKRSEADGTMTIQRDEESRPDPDAPKGFRIPTNNDRKIEDLTCVRVGDTNYYRSKYMRLVTEKKDKIDGHTVFVGDYYQDESNAGGPSAGAIVGGALGGAAVAGGVAALVVTQTDNQLSDTEKGAIIGGAAVAGAVAGGLIGAAASSGDDAGAENAGAAPATATPPTEEEIADTKRYGEILDQKIRVRYIPKMCTDEKCRAEQVAKVGELKAESRMAVHIMAGCIENEDARRVVYGQCRRVFAQVGIRPHLKAIYRHPSIEHVILVGSPDGTGANAQGDTGVAGPDGAAAPASTLIITMNGGQEETFNLAANQTVSSVVGRITSWLEGLRDDGTKLFYTLTVPRPTIAPPSAGSEASQYILVFSNAEHSEYAKVDGADSTDSQFSVGNPSLSPAKLGEVPKSETSAAHTLIKASCRTEWCDCIIIANFKQEAGTTLYGLAMRHPKVHRFSPGTMCISDSMTGDPHDSRYTFAHEVGHVLMNVNHCTSGNHSEQLMITGNNASDDATEKDGRRRIMDKPMHVNYKIYGNDPTVGSVMTLLGSGANKTATERCHMFLSGVRSCFGGPTDRVRTEEW